MMHKIYIYMYISDIYISQFEYTSEIERSDQLCLGEKNRPRERKNDEVFVIGVWGRESFII